MIATHQDQVWFQDGKTHAQPRQSSDCRCGKFVRRHLTARGKSVVVALPHAETEAMRLYLDEIGRHVADGTYAVLLMDRGRIARQQIYDVFERSMSSGLTRGWIPVRVKKTRQIKIMEPRF